MKKKPELIVIAGPNGSGKTSITSRILKHEWIEGCTYINPDNIARDRFGDWNSPEAVLQAANYATEQREKCLVNRGGLIFETVLSAPDKLEFITRAQEADYFIRLFFVGTDHPSINASRITNRVLEGGHDVPITKIVSRYAKSIANCCQVASIVDRMYIYDNSIDNAFPKLLFRTVDGQIKKFYTDINPWAQIILQAVNRNPG
jgi:predicted ABC-type ATPase